MNAFNKKASTILVLALCVTAIDARACGEVMYRMGGALRYHAFVTRHPAAVLVYAGPVAQQHFSGDRTKLRDNLEKAGHKVTLAKGPAELSEALSAHSYDVIIAYAGDLDSVTTQIAQASRNPTLIPVIDRDAKDERAMRERFPRLVNEDANLNQFLKLIEQSMKAKGV
jgi:hypothetical protein